MPPPGQRCVGCGEMWHTPEAAKRCAQRDERRRASRQEVRRAARQDQYEGVVLKGAALKRRAHDLRSSCNQCHAASDGQVTLDGKGLPDEALVAQHDAQHTRGWGV